VANSSAILPASVRKAAVRDFIHTGAWKQLAKHKNIWKEKLSMKSNDQNTTTSIALFQEKTVRRVWHNGCWYFSIIDVITVLTDSNRPRKYWNDLKTKLAEEGYIEVSEKIGQLKMQAPDGKMRETDAADTPTLLRIIQSIPSPKAEPFKRWLAEVGNQRLQEIENPELAMERMRTLYRQKGYPDEWIEQRIRGIAVREELTDEWQKRGAQAGRDYAILTNEISQATFGVNIQDHKAQKSLQRENLRDHMTNMELILTMLGEATATTLHQDRESEGMTELQRDAHDAGDVAGNTRRNIEALTGNSVVSPKNYLSLPSKKRKQIGSSQKDSDTESEPEQ
jgi:prophage antirepressor-like protein